MLSGCEWEATRCSQTASGADGIVTMYAATIDGIFKWAGVSSPDKVGLDLRSARVGVLWDESASWPPPGRLFLDGLEYHQIHDGSPTDVPSRLAWLQLQHEFRTQPWEQVASVLRRSGQEAEAVAILIACQKEQASRSNLIWYGTGWLIGYGYRPLRGLIVACGWVVLGSVVFATSHRKGLLLSVHADRDARAKKADHDPRFHALIYSLDTFTPLIDLHQAEHWLPDPKSGSILHVRGCALRTGQMVRWYHWLHIIAGWVISTLVAIGVSGVVRY